MKSTQSTIQDLTSFRLPDGFRGRPGWFVLLWQIVSASIFHWSFQPMYGFRRSLLRAFGAKIGHHVLIRPTARITYPWRIVIGDNSWIGDFATLYSLDRIEIGANTVISQHVYVCTGTHDYKHPSFSMQTKPIKIGDSVWIATGTFISPGCSIGDGAIVAAKSVVVHDVLPMSKNAGSPSKIIGQRPFTTQTS